jgi:hypothetical protein
MAYIAAAICGLFIFAFIVISVLVMTWILATLLPLVGITTPITWIHGLAVWLLVGFFSRTVTVRSGK